MTSKIADIRLVASHPEVYEPCDDSFALVDALLADRMNLLQLEPTMCLEIGCGSGYVITSLALMLGQDTNSSVHCFATDINPDAVEVTLATLKAHGVHAEVMNMDIASALEDRLAGLVDVVVVNPPYVPTPEDEVGAGGIGWLYMLTLAANKPSELCGLMRKKGYASKIIVQRSTEEESLHVIKFWRDPDSEVQIKKAMANRGSPTSIFSRLSRLSFSGHGNANSK
uniref:Methyltransferase small domain-containing protein n=1 Tax=Chenopodium quinoa TaxID=63459 RepID=A0A803KTE9_CHEQI